SGAGHAAAEVLPAQGRPVEGGDVAEGGVPADRPGKTQRKEDAIVTPKKKRNKPMNTTKPTLARLAELGFTVENVDVYLPWARRRRDFSTAADVLAFKAGTPGVLAVQCTSRDNIAARVKKCLSSASAREWLQAGNRIEVWGWFRVQEGRKKAWRVS